MTRTNPPADGSDQRRLAAQLEALLIVAEQPLSPVALAAGVDQPVHVVTQQLRQLQEEYDRHGRGFELRDVGGGYRFYAREAHDALIERFVGERSQSKLSQAALETLTVIAYRQPISRGQIAAIRAVNVDSVVRTLVTRGLVTEVGEDPETGAILYGTTDALLEHLGIRSLDELPLISPLLDDGAEGFEHDPTQ